MKGAFKELFRFVYITVGVCIGSLAAHLAVLWAANEILTKLLIQSMTQ